MFFYRLVFKVYISIDSDLELILKNIISILSIDSDNEINVKSVKKKV